MLQYDFLSYSFMTSSQKPQEKLDQEVQNYIDEVHNKQPDKPSIWKKLFNRIGFTQKSTGNVLRVEDSYQTAIDSTGAHIPIKSFADRDILDEANRNGVSFIAMKNYIEHGTPFEKD